MIRTKVETCRENSSDFILCKLKDLKESVQHDGQHQEQIMSAFFTCFLLVNSERNSNCVSLQGKKDGLWAPCSCKNFWKSIFYIKRDILRVSGILYFAS